ncbi:MAG: ABC transporter ATP-binding protein [Aureliella sp.]
MSESLIHMQNVSRFYKTVIGVGDVSLELPTGAYGLIGPNGSGKTTLINLLTGMLSPSLGSVRVFNANPQRERQVLSRIGLCPATDILYPNITGFQWVRYQVGLHGISGAEAQRRTSESLEQVGMDQNMHSPIGSYSLGMRQRVKVAQAISHDPDLLILDEPFNGLDPIGRHELTAFLKDWHAGGKSLILASHILHEVESVTSAFLLIYGGRILAAGDASEVRSMLSGFPVEVQLKGDGLRLIVQRLATETCLDGVEFGADGRSVKLQVSDGDHLQQQLSELATQPGVNVESIDSPDGTLEAAFELLLKVHRGENRRAP